jgi:ribosomal protein L11 methyltransferase
LILTPQIKEGIRTDGLFIASGFIKDKKESIVEKLESEGFEFVDVMEDDDWVAIISKRLQSI